MLGSRERFGSFRAPVRGGIEWREIVGVVSDIRSSGYFQDIQPEVYFCHKQFQVYDPNLIVRTSGQEAAVAQAIRHEMQALNNRAVITKVRTLEQVASESVAAPRARATIVAAFSFLAVLLGMVGVYGVMS